MLESLSGRLRGLLDRLWQEWKQLETDIEAITGEIERISNEDARCRQLRQIPGFGPLVSTATVAAIGNGAAFRRGRHFAAWVGVVPRQYSTGGKQKLCGISKRGNVYLRRMLIHGARAVLFRVKYDTAGLGSGCTDSPSVLPAIRWWWPLRINWRASLGPCCPAAGTIDISRCSQRQLDGSGKDATLGKHRTLSTFPPPRRRALE
jgi:Transposase IS116/IS110/IS902 family